MKILSLSTEETCLSLQIRSASRKDLSLENNRVQLVIRLQCSLSKALMCLRSFGCNGDSVWSLYLGARQSIIMFWRRSTRNGQRKIMFHLFKTQSLKNQKRTASVVIHEQCWCWVIHLFCPSARSRFSGREKKHPNKGSFALSLYLPLPQQLSIALANGKSRLFDRSSALLVRYLLEIVLDQQLPSLAILIDNWFASLRIRSLNVHDLPYDHHRCIG